MKRKTDTAKLVMIHKALGNIIKARKDSLAPGTYTRHGTVRFRVDGTLTVGNEYSQKIVAKAKPWAIVSVLFDELAALRESAGMIGIDLARIAHIADTVDDAVADRARAAADKAIAVIKATTTTVCAGKTTMKVRVK